MFFQVKHPPVYATIRFSRDLWPDPGDLNGEGTGQYLLLDVGETGDIGQCPNKQSDSVGKQRVFSHVVGIVGDRARSVRVCGPLYYCCTIRCGSLLVFLCPSAYVCARAHVCECVCVCVRVRAYVCALACLLDIINNNSRLSACSSVSLYPIPTLTLPNNVLTLYEQGLYPSCQLFT